MDRLTRSPPPSTAGTTGAISSGLTPPEAIVEAAEERRRPPVGVSGLAHERRHEHATDDGGVDEHREGLADAELL
jgi:hypothetical protein